MYPLRQIQKKNIYFILVNAFVTNDHKIPVSDQVLENYYNQINPKTSASEPIPEHQNNTEIVKHLFVLILSLMNLINFEI